MKKLLPFSLLLFLFFSCSEEESFQTIDSSQFKEYTNAEINAFIESKTSKGIIFDWQEAPLDMIHSAATASDQLIAIGYTINGQEDLSEIIGLQDELSSEFLQKRTEILNAILESEKEFTGNAELTFKELLPYELDNEIPTLAVRITSPETLVMLESDVNVRYIEPMGYDPKDISGVVQKSSSGCGGNPSSINSSDYTNTSSYNAKIPWNFSNHNIQSAWNTSNGDNISICIIDTGASDSQDNLGSQFASGNSSSRYIQKYSTKYSGWWWNKKLDSPHDQCGHGTSMAGLAAGPWSTDGNAMGAAYKANLVTVRAVEDVLISTSDEKNGVKNALKLAGNRSDVKVVSMSIGNIISSGTVKDGIYYAYNRGKLLLAAAGTSTSFTNWAGVIFPANMSQTTAVTGVKAQSSYSRCNTCHSGNKVDFTIQMQRSFNSNRNTISITKNGNGSSYVGGSSAATATTAGIAALVWATNPSMSRTSVLNRLKQASDIYPSRNSQYGWGNINAQAAVAGTSY
jgi:hypothetical protein